MIIINIFIIIVPSDLCLSPPADLPRPSIQRERLLPSTAQQYGSVPAHRRNPPGLVARPGEPSSARPEPEGLLSPIGSRQGVGPLHPLPFPQDLPAALLHRPGWAAGLHICTDDHPRVRTSSSIICRHGEYHWRAAIPSEGGRG